MEHHHGSIIVNRSSASDQSLFSTIRYTVRRGRQSFSLLRFRTWGSLLDSRIFSLNLNPKRTILRLSWMMLSGYGSCEVLRRLILPNELPNLARCSSSILHTHTHTSTNTTFLPLLIPISGQRMATPSSSDPTWNDWKRTICRNTFGRPASSRLCASCLFIPFGR